MEKKICLGSAQFGSNYGITNKKGQLNIDEVQEILDYAYDQGIEYIDTAQDYGDSELIIGRCLSNKKNMKIISKLKSHTSQIYKKNDIKILQDNLYRSLRNLKINSLECLLFHNEKDLLNEANELLLDWISTLKKSGLIKKIGISIYDFKNILE